ncbi:hypothetical protein DFR70_11436 [Nocardia tenerifensis]|uniref:Uncharacterized protein n=1 Tax=Nocardia tenerifensis TaxID=228006 RepID=A0A318JT38_9NOCA|nr:hypothetical protein DFR70_11436 [Nocardia tenerifensis]
MSLIGSGKRSGPDHSVGLVTRRRRSNGKCYNNFQIFEYWSPVQYLMAIGRLSLLDAGGRQLDG